MKIIIGNNYQLAHDWNCDNGALLGMRGEIVTVDSLGDVDLNIIVQGHVWTVSVDAFKKSVRPTRRLTREQLLANFRLLTELSQRNTYAQYRGAVLELCEIIRKSEVKPTAKRKHHD